MVLLNCLNCVDIGIQAATRNRTRRTRKLQDHHYNATYDPVICVQCSWRARESCGGDISKVSKAGMASGSMRPYLLLLCSADSVRVSPSMACKLSTS